LAKALSDNPELKGYTLVNAEEQLANGFNFRLTFENDNGTQIQVIENFNLGSLLPSAYVAGTTLVNLSDFSIYSQALSAAFAAFP